jgi:hypothetical protein
LFFVFALCVVFYYFGEIIDAAGWDAIRFGFFFGVHDVHRLLYLAPILYAAYVFGIRAVLIVSIFAAASFLPRALLISPYPDPLLRSLLFAVIAGVLGYVVAVLKEEVDRRRRLHEILGHEKEALRAVLSGLPGGVVVIGPDYKIRFANPALRVEFGDGVGAYCYRSFKGANAPCAGCGLRYVQKGEGGEWGYVSPGGRAYRVSASPYVDTDGVACAVLAFRQTT